jgi:transcription termination factor Rho
MADEFGMAKGMTLEGYLRPVGEGEKYFCLSELTAIDGGEPEDV